MLILSNRRADAVERLVTYRWQIEFRIISYLTCLGRILSLHMERRMRRDCVLNM